MADLKTQLEKLSKSHEDRIKKVRQNMLKQIEEIKKAKSVKD